MSIQISEAINTKYSYVIKRLDIRQQTMDGEEYFFPMNLDYKNCKLNDPNINVVYYLIKKLK